MSSAPTSRGFRCSFPKSGRSSSRMPGSSPPGLRRRSICSSPAASAAPGPDGDAAAYSARLGYETGSWSNLARIIQVGRDFDPQVGFLNRGGGYRFYEGTVMWKKRFPGVPWLKDWHPHVGYRGYYGLDGYWQEGRIHLDITEVSLANGAMIGPEVNIEHQGLTQPFAIASTVTLPVGSYDYRSVGLDFGTNLSAPVAVTLRADV